MTLEKRPRTTSADSNRKTQPSWQSRRQKTPSQEKPALTDLTLGQIIFVLLLHAPLMPLFTSIPFLAMIHSLLTLLVGLNYLMRDKQPTRVIWVIAYMTSFEIIWRGADAVVIWEYVKYTTLLLAILTLLRYQLLKRVSPWTLLIAAALLPGILIMPKFDREAISAQLAGLFSMIALSMMFSALTFKKADAQRLFLALIAPNVVLTTLILFNLASKGITFYGGGANEEITNGVGANQVTSALSLGAVAAFFYIFIAGKDAKVRNLMIGLVVAFVVSSMLTFSRAGLWNTLIAITAGVFFLIRDRAQRIRVFGVLVLFTIFGYFVLFPSLNNVTGGALAARFSYLDTTGRDVLVKIDYQVFRDNPVFGVGVGQSLRYHIPYFGYAKPTHTEYSRLLAEHGIFGVFIILLLASSLAIRVLIKGNQFQKSVSVGFTSWALFYMVHAATRMAAPSFAFGLGAASFSEEETSQQDPPPSPQRLTHTRRL